MVHFVMLAFVRYVATTSRIAVTDGGTQFEPLQFKSRVLSELPNRAPSRAALFKLCLMFHAVPKSMIPTRNTRSMGSDNANSRSCDPACSERTLSRRKNFGTSLPPRTLVFLPHLCLGRNRGAKASDKGDLKGHGVIQADHDA